MPEDVIPMWVADMDFQAAPCITEAIENRIRHGIFGYSVPDSGYFDTLCGWFERRFAWKTEREWIAQTPGVVNSLYIAIRALTAPDDGVVVQQPVYNPFWYAIRDTGRRLVNNELVYYGGRYGIDFDDFEEKIKGAKLFILCSPHNPTSRVWTREELFKMGEICLRHGVPIISDEIHQDIVYPDKRHHMLASLDERFADITVTCTAPSKTFNLAGLQLSNIIIPNEGLRGRFKQEYKRSGLNEPGVIGLTACKAAYDGGEGWLEELLAYLGGNFAMLHEFLCAKLPKVRLVEPEGTYLAWIDFSGLGYTDQELNDLMRDKARLWLNSGVTYGAGGAGFQRMNLGCPRSVLSEALKRLESAFGG